MDLDIHKVKSATTILLTLSGSCDVYAFFCFTKACRPGFTCLKYHPRILNEKWIQLNCTLTQEVYCNFFLNVEVYGKIRYDINHGMMSAISTDPITGNKLSFCPVDLHQVNNEQQHLNKLHLIRGQSGSGSSQPYLLCPFISIKNLHIIGQENNIITFYIKKHQRA